MSIKAAKIQVNECHHTLLSLLPEGKKGTVRNGRKKKRIWKNVLSAVQLFFLSPADLFLWNQLRSIFRLITRENVCRFTGQVEKSKNLN